MCLDFNSSFGSLVFKAVVLCRGPASSSWSVWVFTMNHLKFCLLDFTLSNIIERGYIEMEVFNIFFWMSTLLSV